MRKVIVQEPVKIPSVSTDTPEHSYSFDSFVEEFILRSEGMRLEENIPKLLTLAPKLMGHKEPGTVVELTDEEWLAAKTSAKAMIDALMVPRQGAQPFPLPIIMPILSIFHSFASTIKD